MTFHFDLLSRVYDRIFPPPPVDDWRRVFGTNRLGVILDVGGGTGRVASVLTEFAERVIVCDPSPGMLRQASSRPELVSVRAEAEDLPLRSSSLDAVVVVDALHHFRDQRAALSEMARVVRRGGRVIIDEPDLRYRAVRLIWFLEKLSGMRSRFLPPNRIAECLEELGFRTAILEASPLSARIVAEKRPARGAFEPTSGGPEQGVGGGEESCAC